MMPFDSDLFTAPVCQRLTWTLLHFCWQGLAVAAFVAVWLRLFRPARAETRYAFCLIGLVLMIAVPVATFLLIPSPQLPSVAVRPIREPAVVESPVLPPAIEPVALPAVDAVILNEPPRVEPAEMPIVAEVPDAPTLIQRLPAIFQNSQPYLLVGWTLGVLLLGMRLMIGYAGVQLLRRQREPLADVLTARIVELGRRVGLRGCPRVFASRVTREAIAVGFCRPVVLVPAAWLLEMSPEALEAVIAHELAHLRRWDLWVNLMQRMAETLLFYHPAVWWLSRRVRLEREMCCDALAVAATGRRIAYLRALEWVARKKAMPSRLLLDTSMCGRTPSLLSRVRYLVGLDSHLEKTRWWPVGLAAVLLVATTWIVMTGGAASGGTKNDVAKEKIEKSPQTEASPFPSGPHVHVGRLNQYLGKRLSQVVYFEAGRYGNLGRLFDFDSERIVQVPPVPSDVDTSNEKDYLSWADRQGADLVGAEFRVDDKDVLSWARRKGFDPDATDPMVTHPGFFCPAVKANGMRLWQIDNGRWDTIERELQSGKPLKLGRPAKDWLIDFDTKTKRYRPLEPSGSTLKLRQATFLFVTRDGACGILRTNSDVLLETQERIRSMNESGDLWNTGVEYRLFYASGRGEGNSRSGLGPGTGGASGTRTPSNAPMPDERETHGKAAFVSLEGTLKPVNCSRVFAAVDGVVKRVHVKHGQAVEKGSLLLELSNKNLASHLLDCRRELDMLHEQLRSKRRASKVGKFDDQDQHDRLLGEIRQLETKESSLKLQIETLREKEDSLKILSPRDGRVVGWDLENNLENRPIRRGQQLMEIADIDGPWCVELTVPEDRVGQIVQAQKKLGNDLPVTFILATEPRVKHKGKIRAIDAGKFEVSIHGLKPQVDHEGRITAFEGKIEASGKRGNRTVVHVDIEDAIDTDHLRPGTKVRAKIDLAPADAVPAPTTEPALTPEQRKTFDDAIRVLRTVNHGKHGSWEQWAPAVRSLAALGRPAVPLLIKEIEKTDDRYCFSTLVFALRAIGDARAVPALVRMIPRTLTMPMGDYGGMTVKDKELHAFMCEHDMDDREGEQPDQPGFAFGSPRNELFATLRRLTGKRFAYDEITALELVGTPRQRAMQRRLFHDEAQRWAKWWEANWRNFTKDPAYAKVNLAPLDPADLVLLARSGRPIRGFATGPDVRIWPSPVDGVEQMGQVMFFFRDDPEKRMRCLDLDTFRVPRWPHELPSPEKLDPSHEPALAAWARRDGVDLLGVEYRPPGSDRIFHVVRALGMKVWQIDNDRWPTISEELADSKPLALGRPADDLLMHYDTKTARYVPDAPATFLFITREGARGVLQVNNDNLKQIFASMNAQRALVKEFPRVDTGVEYRLFLAADEKEEGSQSGPGTGTGESGVPRAAATEPALTPEQQKTYDQAIGVLRTFELKSRHEDDWARAIRSLVELGPPAVPRLIEELERTDRNLSVRALAFTLRATGDRRAVPALVRTIPRAATMRRGDYGLLVEDPGLLKFMQKHDCGRGNGGQHFDFGCPMHEILTALGRLTGQRFKAGELNFVHFGGAARQRAMQRRVFHDEAQRWAAWWEANWSKFTQDTAYAKVNLPPMSKEDLALLASPADTSSRFPSGKDVEFGNGMTSTIGWPPRHLHKYDFDTGREASWPKKFPRPAKLDRSHEKSITEWARHEGIDLLGLEFRSAGDDRPHAIVKGVGLRAWRLDERRIPSRERTPSGPYSASPSSEAWDAIEESLKSGEPLELGEPAGEVLMAFDPAAENYEGEQQATYLFITADGARGIMLLQAHIGTRRLRNGKTEQILDLGVRRRLIYSTRSDPSEAVEPGVHSGSAVEETGEPETEASVEAFWRAVDARREAVESFDWQLDAPSLTMAPDRASSKGPVREHVMVDGNRVRIDRRGVEAIVIEGPDGKHQTTAPLGDFSWTTVLVGPPTKSDSPTAGETAPAGRAESAADVTCQESVAHRPLFLCYRLREWISWNQQHRKGGDVTVRPEVVDGRSLVAVSWRMGSATPVYTRKIWFDPERDYLPVRERDGMEDEYLQWDVQYAEDGRHGYIPTAWTVSSTHPGGKDQPPQVHRVTRWEINTKLPAGTFDLPPVSRRR
ncbi:MAG: HlyD family efflux transporter periplasmic adaptor subunit [Pirellulales bacterium]|nr:HlyD family efflux transporter periplasmic adaptor subunit [Pirellulales bacterium]